jgi:hypothetical protein
MTTPSLPSTPLTERERDALMLLVSKGGRIDAGDRRGDAFSNDGHPYTWNRLFRRGLAIQKGAGAEDAAWIDITELGSSAVGAARHG